MLIRNVALDATDMSSSSRLDAAEHYVEQRGNRSLFIVDREAPRTPDEQPVRLLFSSGRVGRAAGPWLFHVALWTPADFRDEFLAWYSVEHLPILLECRLWDGCRFVETSVVDGCQFYALHQLADVAALESRQRKVSRSTPWFVRLKEHDWFDEAFVRTLYRRASAGECAA